MTTIDDTLAERGARYGDFTDHARVAQALQDTMRAAGDTTGWQALSAVQKQALTVIADKIARILTGDPNYADNWHDIQGYAKLVEDRLPNVGALLDSVSMEPPVVDGWIEWHGGVRPVARGIRVECRFRNGRQEGPSTADNWRWHWMGDSYDIVAYRIVKETP